MLRQVNGDQGRGDRLRMSFMLPSMKRPPVSTPPVVSSSLPSRWSESIPSGAHEVRQPSIRALEVARLSSPAHEGSRGVGAPSMRRLCDSSQATCRAHPPIEPAQARRGSHSSHLGGHPIPGKGKGFRACTARWRVSGEGCGAEAQPGGRPGRGATASSSGRPPGTDVAPHA